MNRWHHQLSQPSISNTTSNFCQLNSTSITPNNCMLTWNLPECIITNSQSIKVLLSSMQEFKNLIKAECLVQYFQVHLTNHSNLANFTWLVFIYPCSTHIAKSISHLDSKEIQKIKHNINRLENMISIQMFLLLLITIKAKKFTNFKSKCHLSSASPLNST